MPHSPEELARLSTLVHNVLGWLLVILSVVLVVEIRRGVPQGGARFVWPALGATIGFGLAIWVFFHQIVSHGLGPYDDPLQNQHQAIGWLAGIGSALELARRVGASERLAFGFPLAIVGVGVAFLVHEQHDLKALVVHWALAGTLVASGCAWTAALLSGEDSRAMRLFAAFLLLASAGQLAAYREAPGAHGPAPSAAPAAGHDAH